MTLLFKVQDTFVMTGKGLILTPGSNEHAICTGDPLLLITPHGNRITATVKGVTFGKRNDILIDDSFAKNDVPIGTEVWLID